MKPIHEQCEARRVALGISKAEMARAAGCGRAELINWLNGKQKSLRTEILERVLEALGAKRFTWKVGGVKHHV